MIITLTPNTGIDHTIQITSFQLNSTIRAIDSAWGMGGKATDVSWILGKLGIPTRALGFAAGPNGVRMEKCCVSVESRQTLYGSMVRRD